MYLKAAGTTIQAYPYSLYQLRLDNPRVSVPAEPDAATLAKFNTFAVAQVERPAITAFQTVTEGTPALVGGAWTQVWIVTERPSEEKAAIFEAARLNKRGLVNQLRDGKESAVAPTPFGYVDADAMSAKRLLAIQAAATTSLMLDLEWEPQEWTMADNSAVLLDTPAKALQLASAVTGFAAQLHGFAKGLKEQVDAVVWDPENPEQSLAELEGIDVETGWPA